MHDQKAAILVHHQAREAIGLGIDQPVGGSLRFKLQQLATGDRLPNFLIPKLLVDYFHCVPTQDARPYLGVGIEVGLGQPAAVGRYNRNQVTGLWLARHLSNRPGKEPGMPV